MQTTPLALDEGAVILPGLTGKHRFDYFNVNGEAGLEGTSDDNRWSVTLYRCRSAKSTWQRPGTWWGNETRTDQHGRKWFRAGLCMVQDDFGNLVEVAA